MNNSYFRRAGFRTIYWSTAVLIIFCVSIFFSFIQEKPLYTPEEFTKLIRDFSEPGGYFQSDNWVSNETSILEVLDPLKENGIKGGVYIGVGPEQNFTYITAVKPEIAFIVDIRQQNRMQHLYYKVLFEIAETRADFLSLLLCKPLDPKQDKMLKQNHNIDSLVTYFYLTPPDPKLQDKTRQKVLEILEKKYMFQLSPSEQSELNYVVDAFYQFNINITYNTYNMNITNINFPNRSGNRGSMRSPTLGALLCLQAPDGSQRNPFNSDEDYAYLRKMNRENRIIPITGNFGGTKALASIAQYLSDKKMTVSAMYVSNVEQYLFRNYLDWNQWTANVKALPITAKSVFIRYTRDSSGFSGTQQVRLQWIKTFIKNCDEGRYLSYSDLTRLDYIK